MRSEDTLLLLGSDTSITVHRADSGVLKFSVAVGTTVTSFALTIRASLTLAEFLLLSQDDS